MTSVVNDTKENLQVVADKIEENTKKAKEAVDIGKTVLAAAVAVNEIYKKIEETK